MTIEDAQARLQTEMQVIYQNVEHVLHTEYAGFDSAAGPGNPLGCDPSLEFFILTSK